MATPRTTIKNAIKADNPAFIVDSYPNLPDHLGKGKVHVSVWRTDLKTYPQQPNALEHSLNIQIAIPLTTGDTAEDAADEAIDAVLLSLQRIEHLSWSTAERVSFDEAFIGYKITASATSINPYRTAVLESN